MLDPSSLLMLGKPSGTYQPVLAAPDNRVFAKVLTVGVGAFIDRADAWLRPGRFRKCFQESKGIHTQLWHAVLRETPSTGRFRTV